MTNINLNDIIKLANLNNKDKIRLAQNLLEDVQLSIPDAGKGIEHQEILEDVIKKIDTIG